MILAHSSAFGQRAGLAALLAPPAAPAITILTAATGSLLRSEAAGNASVDLGRIAYFNGASAPGQSSRKNSGSFVVSTRFGLRVDCPGSTGSSKVNVTVARLDADNSHAMRIDGTTLGFAEQKLVQSMACGSGGEHRLDVEIPVSTPAGSISSTIAFVATLNR
jgi:hypothetical protein